MRDVDFYTNQSTDYGSQFFVHSASELSESYKCFNISRIRFTFRVAQFMKFRVIPGVFIKVAFSQMFI